MKKFAALALLLLTSSTTAAGQTRESLSTAATRIARDTAISAPESAQSRGRDEWNKVRRLPDVSVIRVVMRDGTLKDGHLGYVADDGIMLLTAAALPPDAREALLVVAKAHPNVIEQRAFRYKGLTVEHGAILFDGTRVGDVGSVFMEIDRDAIAEIKRPVRGSILGGILGAAVGGVAGLASAFNLAFNQCGGSCRDESLLMAGSLIGMPLAGGYIGAKVMPHPEWTTVYRGR